MTFSQESFLEDIVTPYFWGSINKNIYSVIYDADGKIYLCTNKFAKMMGYDNWDELRGKTILEYSLQLPQIDTDFYENLENIRKRVINESLNYQYINFISNHEGIVSQMVYHFPIFMPNGEVAGSRVIACKFNMIDDAINKFVTYLKKHDQNIQAKNKKPEFKINLTEKEYTLVFLLGAGLNIEDISIFLDTTTTKILSTLENSICKKFGLNMLDLNLIRQFILEGNIINKLPKKFMKSRSIILQHTEIAQDYFTAKF